MKKFGLLFLAIIGLMISSGLVKESKAQELTVFHSKFCGCCKKWMAHLKQNGFKVTSKEVSDVNSVKSNLNVPGALSSCHTAVVGGYIVEGHVPAKAIKKLLAERPKIRGIGVAGMLIGSPGMEGAYSERYSVSAFTHEILAKSFMEF